MKMISKTVFSQDVRHLVKKIFPLESTASQSSSKMALCPKSNASEV